MLYMKKRMYLLKSNNQKKKRQEEWGLNPTPIKCTNQLSNYYYSFA